MAKRKGFLQKTASVSGGMSFALAIVCCVLLYLRIGDPAGHDPITASLMASVFFFVCVGVILTIIGRSDIPSFKFDD